MLRREGRAFARALLKEEEVCFVLGLAPLAKSLLQLLEKERRARADLRIAEKKSYEFLLPRNLVENGGALKGERRAKEARLLLKKKEVKFSF